VNQLQSVHEEQVLVLWMDDRAQGTIIRKNGNQRCSKDSEMDLVKKTAMDFNTALGM
jgi:hypothetical protein